MTRARTIVVPLLVAGLLAGSASLVILSLPSSSPIAAQAQADLEKLKQEIALAEAEVTRLDQQLANKNREATDNRNAQARDPENGELKTKGVEIARQLNELNTQLTAKRTEVENRVAALRSPAREIVAQGLNEAETKLAANDAKSAKEALTRSSTALSAWREGFTNWRDYVHKEEARLPPVGPEAAKVAQSELQRLNDGIARLRVEKSRLDDEVTSLTALVAKNLNHPDWKALKDGLSSLHASMKQRRDDIVNRLKAYDTRLTELKKHIR